MNLGVVLTYHLMSILLTMNKHHFQSFTAAFCFAHAKQNLAQAVNNISESAMWNSSKPIKFAHLSKLGKQPE